MGKGAEEEHLSTLLRMHNLVLTYQLQDLWKEVEELQLQTVESRKKVPRGRHLDTLTFNLALMYRAQGWWEDVQELQVQAVEVSERVMGRSILLHWQAWQALRQRIGVRRIKEAEELEVHILETRKRIPGENHPDTLTGTNNLASASKPQKATKKR
ncbi:MAG: hypothetical protein M1839_007907 [Geoglossum umbratile]|nr:MAG: hypothetical protein M1839_007907 [Geoglossum umbratile]